ncbi:MAG: hypothetical protein U1A78_00035 [Polyangia bacterium]
MKSHRLVSLSSVSERFSAGRLLGGVLLGALAVAGAAGCSFSLSERAVCTDMECVPIIRNDGGTSTLPDMAVYVDDPSKAGPFRTVSVDQAMPTNIGLAGDKVTLVVPSDDGTRISSKQATYPLVLILPARTVDPMQMKVYAERLASHGFIACLLRAANEANHAQYRTSVGQTLYYLTGDMASMFKANLDKGKVGIVGHQLGGKIAFGLLLNNSSAVHAAFGIDPVNEPGNFDGLIDLGNVDTTSRKPIALLGEPLSKVPPAGLTACAPADQNYEKFYEAYKGSAISITFPGATLPDFVPGYVDSTCGTATMGAAATQDLAVKYTTAYFQWTLLGKQRAREHLLGADFNQDKATYSLTSVNK